MHKPPLRKDIDRSAAGQEKFPACISSTLGISGFLACFSCVSGFGHQIFHIFLGRLDLGEHHVSGIQSPAQNISHQGPEIQLALAHGRNTGRSQQDAAQKKQSALHAVVHGFDPFLRVGKSLPRAPYTSNFSRILVKHRTMGEKGRRTRKCLLIKIFQLRLAHGAPTRQVRYSPYRFPPHPCPSEMNTIKETFVALRGFRNRR